MEETDDDQSTRHPIPNVRTTKTRQKWRVLLFSNCKVFLQKIANPQPIAVPGLANFFTPCPVTA